MVGFVPSTARRGRISSITRIIPFTSRREARDRSSSFTDKGRKQSEKRGRCSRCSCLGNGTRVEIIRINTRLAGSILFVNPVNQSRSLGGFIAATTEIVGERYFQLELSVDPWLLARPPIYRHHIHDFNASLPRPMVKKEKKGTRYVFRFFSIAIEIDLPFGLHALRGSSLSWINRIGWFVSGINS